jgi:hypothetical protein
MNVTVNQIRQEMTTLVQAHEMVNSFFWGDFHRAYNEKEQFYPLVCSYLSDGAINTNLTQMQLVVIVCDKTFKGFENLNDTESDTLTVARHLYNVIRQSPRWNALLRVNSSTFTKFYENTSDEVAGVILTMNVDIKQSRSLCDLPLDNYDFDGTFVGNECEPVLIVNSNQSFSFNAPSGTIVELADTPVLVTDQDGNPLANENVPSVTGATVAINLPPCEDANYVVEYANGDPIESGTIPSGGFEMVIVPNCPAVDPSDVFINGVEIGTTTNGEQFDITVEQGGVEVGSFVDGVWVVPECEPCPDAKAFLKDTDGNILSITSIPSGTSEDIIAPDATFDINGVQVATILSGGSDSIEVRRASGSTQVGSLQGQYWRVANTTVQLRDSAANNIGAVNSYGAETANNLTAPDGTVTVRRDGVFFATQVVRSNGTETVNVPSVVSTPKGQMPLKTFQTTPQGSGTDGDLEQGYGVSYAVLPYNNPFGNTNRFTAPDGSQTYTDAIACDWLTWNESTNTVLMIHFGSAAGQVLATNRSLADGITYINTLTVGGYSGWNMINKNQLENIVDNEVSINNLNVAPFNIGALAIQTNTAYSATSRVVREATGRMATLTSTARTLAVRIGTVAGTVIS